MHRRALAIVVTFCGLAAGTLSPLYAQAAGRYLITVIDEAGERLPGVQVTVTTQALENFREEKTTDRKGRVTLAFKDSTLYYDLRLELEGHQTLEMRIKPEAKKTKAEEVTLPAFRQAEASVTASSGVAIRFTPAEAAFNTGVEALGAGDLATAEQRFLEATELDPRMIDAHSGLAGVYIEQESFEAALTSAERVLELDPESSRAVRVLYLAHQGLGQASEAAAALERLKHLDRGGGTAAMVFNEGVDALRVGDHAAAKQRFEEALELDPDLAPAHSSLAVIHRDLGEWPEAVAAAERALGVDPGNLAALDVRHQAYQALGDSEKEAEAFAALAAANPEAMSQQLFGQAVSKFESGETGDAVRLLERVLQLTPDHPRAHYRLGLCYVNMSRTEDAKRHFSRFVELAPDDPEAQSARDMIGFLE